MRLDNAPCTSFLLVVLAAPVFAQVGPDIRFVNVPVAEVRCGPSDKPEFYVTNRLEHGQAVEVVAEEPGGWLAIRPPEGSFSYISTRFLRHIYPNQANHVVTLAGTKAPVFVGSEIMNKRPTIVGSYLERGAQVTSRGQPRPDEEDSWMPIEAPAREKRYLRASAVVKKLPGPAATATSRSAFVPTGTLASSAAPSANAAGTPEQMWQQAQAADRAGKIQEAVKLYYLVAAETARTRPDVSSWAVRRAQYLQGGYLNYGASPGSAQPPSAVQPVAAARGYAATPVSTAGVRIGAPTAPRPEGTPVERTTTLARDSSSFTPLVPIGSPPRGTQATWMGFTGRLRRAGRVDDRVTTWALDDPTTGQPRLYFTAGRGINPDAYDKQIVQVWGYAVYRGDLRSNYVTAARIIPQ